MTSGAGYAAGSDARDARAHVTTRILLDLTTAYAWRGEKAVGIVRTEREVCLRLLEDRSLCILPFIFHGGSMRAVDVEFAHRLLTENEASPGAVQVGPPPASSPSTVARLIRPVGATA